MHSDEIGKRVYDIGLSGILSEGSETILKGRSPYQVYHHPHVTDLKLLFRSTQFSENLAFRFHQNNTNLTVEKYMEELRRLAIHERVIVLGMDYQIFGEYYSVDTGIQSFLESLLLRVA